MNKSFIFIGLVLFFCIFIAKGLAYTESGGAFYCGNSTMSASEICTDCTDALNNNTYDTVYLNNSVTSMAGTCINNPENFTSKTFYGQNYMVGGDTTGYGISLGSGKTNNIIENFTISNFSAGIYLSSSNNNTLSFNKINFSDSGFYLTSSSNNTLNNNTIIQNNYGVRLEPSSNNNTISNNTIYNNTGGTKKRGISVYVGSNNNTISNNNITTHTYGILLYTSNYSEISNNDIISNTYGINLFNANNSFNEISNNNVTSNTHGIRIETGSENNTVSGNTVESNSNGVFLLTASNNTINNNTITKSNVGVYLDTSSNFNTISNNTIYNNTVGSGERGIVINSSSKNNTLSGNNVSSQTYGIISASFNNTISNNNVTLHTYGISLQSSNYSRVLGNNVSSNTYGITLAPSNYTEVSNNTLISNTYGINTNSSSLNNTISSNNITLNTYGILFSNTTNNTISSNTITSEGKNYGIYLNFSSDYNTFSNNTVNSNHYAIAIYNSSSNNTLSNNTINSNNVAVQLENNSNYNDIQNNNLINNSAAVLFSANSGYNTLSSNTICSSLDVYSGNNTNSGDENTCDFVYNWSDSGSTNCTNTCLSNVTDIEFLGISDYYDHRRAVVTITGDDWTSGTATATTEFRNRNIWLTVGIITNQTIASGWTSIQTEVDAGYIEPVSHSRNHNGCPYASPVSEINGSRNDIIGNLTNIPYSKGSTEYVLIYLAPFNAACHSDVKGQSKYISERATDSIENYWVGWNATNGIYNLISPLIDADSSNYSILNNSFDSVYNYGGIHHFFFHAYNHNWSEDNNITLHLDYIKNKTDVWYVGLGHLYLYHCADDPNCSDITVTGNGSALSRNFTITIDSQNHSDYGFAYPVTYEFNLPSNASNMSVYKRYSTSGSWTNITQRNTSDFFNGIEAARFNYSTRRAYVSVMFGNTSDTLYLKFNSSTTPAGQTSQTVGQAVTGPVAAIQTTSKDGTVSVTIPWIENTRCIDMPDIINEMCISVKDKKYTVIVRITKQNETGEKPSGIIYQYFDVYKHNIQDFDIEKVKFRFAVNKSWINENDINESAVTLSRSTLDSSITGAFLGFINSFVSPITGFAIAYEPWTKLDTRKISETENEIIYETESPGLSVFAITGRVNFEPEEIPEEYEKISWEPLIFIIFVIMGLIIFLGRDRK